MEAAQEQPAVQANTQHAKALLAAFNQVLLIRGDDATVFAMGAKRVLDGLQLRGNPRSLPLSAMAGSRGVIRRAEEKEVRAADLAEISDVLSGGHGLDYGNDEDVLVGLLRVLDEALSPTRSALRSDTPNSLGRITRERDRLPQLLSGLDPRHHHPVGADVEDALDEAAVQLGDAHQRDRVASHGGPDVFENLLPVKVTVFGVDDNPVKAEGDGHFRNVGRLQRDPKAVNGFVRRQFLPEPLDCGSFHLVASPGTPSEGFGAIFSSTDARRIGDRPPFQPRHTDGPPAAFGESRA